MNKSNNFVQVELLEKSEFQRHINEVKSLEKNILKITRLRTEHCRVGLHDQVLLEKVKKHNEVEKQTTSISSSSLARGSKCAGKKR